jgi:hypothetical protein
MFGSSEIRGGEVRVRVRIRPPGALPPARPAAATAWASRDRRCRTRSGVESLQQSPQLGRHAWVGLGIGLPDGQRLADLARRPLLVASSKRHAHAHLQHLRQPGSLAGARPQEGECAIEQLARLGERRGGRPRQQIEGQLALARRDAEVIVGTEQLALDGQHLAMQRQRLVDVAAQAANLAQGLDRGSHLVALRTMDAAGGGEHLARHRLRLLDPPEAQARLGQRDHRSPGVGVVIAQLAAQPLLRGSERRLGLLPALARHRAVAQVTPGVGEIVVIVGGEHPHRLPQHGVGFGQPPHLEQGEAVLQSGLRDLRMIVAPGPNLELEPLAEMCIGLHPAPHDVVEIGQVGVHDARHRGLGLTRPVDAPQRLLERRHPLVVAAHAGLGDCQLVERHRRGHRIVSVARSHALDHLLGQPQRALEIRLLEDHGGEHREATHQRLLLTATATKDSRGLLGHRARRGELAGVRQHLGESHLSCRGHRGLSPERRAPGLDRRLGVAAGLGEQAQAAVALRQRVLEAGPGQRLAGELGGDPRRTLVEQLTRRHLLAHRPRGVGLREDADQKGLDPACTLGLPGRPRGLPESHRGPGEQGHHDRRRGHHRQPVASQELPGAVGPGAAARLDRLAGEVAPDVTRQGVDGGITGLRLATDRPQHDGVEVGVDHRHRVIVVCRHRPGRRGPPAGAPGTGRGHRW